MKVKASIASSLVDKQGASSILRAFFEFAYLKQLYRQGWLKSGVASESCESVAEHTFAVAVLAMILCETSFPELDRDKILRMALIHDFGEIYAGDLTPSDPVSPQEKLARERESILQVFEKLPNGDKFIAVWEEYEAGKTLEAQIVREIDRLEMGMQAKFYAFQGLIDPDEFYAAVEQAVKLPVLKKLFLELKNM